MKDLEIERRKRKENILKALTESLKLTERCRDLYAMTYIASQHIVVAYFYGRKIVRIWLDSDDNFEMINEVIKVLGKNTES